MTGQCWFCGVQWTYGCRGSISIAYGTVRMCYPL